MTVYDKSGQRLFFVRETDTYGQPYDPESQATVVPFGTTTTLGDTPIPADYPHWRRFDHMPDAAELSVPIIEKIKSFDIADSKHASALFSGNIEPVDISLELTAQGLEFLAFAIGNPVVNSNTQAMTQIITTVAESGNISQGDYFLFDVIDSSGNVVHYGVWMDTAGDGSTGKPTVTGINASKMLAANISANTPNNTATQIADAIELIIETTLGGGGTSDITSADNVAAVITLIHARNGAVQPAHDGGAATGFTFNGPTTWGCTKYDVTELLTTDLPSFTIRAEARNATSAEDIVWDLYGCVIESIEVNNVFGDKMAKYSLTIKVPYALENTNGRCTNPPPRKQIDAFVAIECLQESTNNALLQSGATCTLNSTDDRTPEKIDKVTLSITNNVAFKSDISRRHMLQACAARRDVTLNVVGNTGEKELYTYFQEKAKWDSTSGAWIPNSASAGKNLNTHFKMQKNATYDYIWLTIFNWKVLEHNFTLVNVDDAVKNVDIKLEDATGDSNGRIIDDCDYVSYIDQVVMTYNA